MSSQKPAAPHGAFGERRRSELDREKTIDTKRTKHPSEERLAQSVPPGSASVGRLTRSSTSKNQER